MLGSILSGLLCLLLTGCVYLFDCARHEAWVKACVEFFAQVPDLHPAEAARRARKLMAEKPEELF